MLSIVEENGNLSYKLATDGAHQYDLFADCHTARHFNKSNMEHFLVISLITRQYCRYKECNQTMHPYRRSTVADIISQEQCESAPKTSWLRSCEGEGTTDKHAIVLIHISSPPFTNHTEESSPVMLLHASG